jgi:hypothetical protein
MRKEQKRGGLRAFVACQSWLDRHKAGTWPTRKPPGALPEKSLPDRPRPNRPARALPLTIAKGNRFGPFPKILANEKFLSFSLALIQITLRMTIRRTARDESCRRATLIN